MPFTVKDVEKHTKKATSAKLKRQWVEVANSSLNDCEGEAADCEATAIRKANGVVAKAVTEADVAEATMKTVGGKQYPAGDFLVVEDPESPDTWHLQVKKNGKVDRRLMGGAKAALTAPKGHRGEPYAGPNKAQAISKLKALYNAEDMEWGEAEVGEYYDEPVAYAPPAGPTSFADLMAQRHADEAADRVHELTWDYQRLISNVMSAPDVTDKVGAIRTLADEFVALIEEALGGGGTEESQQLQDYGLAVEVARDATEADLAEVQVSSFEPGRRAPVVIDFQILKPGPGNKRDNHYYLPETVRRDIHVFEGTDVFATDHKENERSERTKVGKVLKVPTRFTTEGAAVGEVLIYDPDQAEKARNRADANALGTLECSIYGRGRQKKGKVNGGEYQIVEAITQGLYLELVSKAGAGGMALSLSESDGGNHMKENEKPEEEQVEETTFSEAEEETPEAEEETTQEQEAQPLAELDVIKALSASSLPRQSRERLAGLEWKDAGALAEAIKAEAEYVKSLTGSGQPNSLGASEAQQKKPLTEADRVRRFNTIMAEVGGTQVPVPAE